MGILKQHRLAKRKIRLAEFEADVRTWTVQQCVEWLAINAVPHRHLNHAYTDVILREIYRRRQPPERKSNA